LGANTKVAMEKTIKEWLETLPEPIRTEALANMGPLCHKVTVDSLHQSVNEAFVWEFTPQGYNYWDVASYRAEAGEFNNSSLDKDTGK